MELDTLLSSFTITDSNYHTALEVLKKRCDNPRMIARAHVQSVFDLRKDNGKDLKKLIEGVEEHRLSVQALGLPVEHYDLFRQFSHHRTSRSGNTAAMGNSFTWHGSTGL